MIELPETVRLIEEYEGLPFLRINAPGGSGEVFLQGAHLVSWIPLGQRPVLWMSEASRFNPGVPIRGGIPICFPWFNYFAGHPDAPHHGFARILPWTLTKVREPGASVELTLQLSDTPMSRASAWPFQFDLTLTITLGTHLRIELDVVNRDDVAFIFEEAFHTYFAVDDVCYTCISGLEGFDFVVGGEQSAVEDQPIVLGSTGIGRRYPDATSGIMVDSGNQRTISIDSEGSRGVVVWNPGPDTARSLEDFSDDGWPTMICFETCNLGEAAIRLNPGNKHTMIAQFTIAPDR